MDNIVGKKSSLTWAVHISVILLVALWVFPTFGLFVSSFRTGDQISTSGWWRALTTQEAALPAVRVEGAEAPKDGGFAIEGRMFANAGTAVSRWGTSSKETTKYAAGDVASIEHPLRPFRVRNEHWSNAVATGTAAADSLLGMPVIFDDIPSFVSSQFDITLGYSGFSRDLDGASVTYRGDPQSKEFMAFWHHDGIVVGSAYINTSGVSAMVQALIRSGGRVDPALLSDDTRELSTALA